MLYVYVQSINCAGASTASIMWFHAQLVGQRQFVPARGESGVELYVYLAGGVPKRQRHSLTVVTAFQHVHGFGVVIARQANEANSKSGKS